jgi:hypothetical protein
MGSAMIRTLYFPEKEPVPLMTAGVMVGMSFSPRD